MVKSYRACGVLAGAIIIAVAIAEVSSETFHFPDFVAIERNENAVCGGWIIDKTFRRYVLATRRCAADAGDVRELLVRHGSAKITWRTLSSGVDRKLYHPAHQGGLVVLSTYGKFRRQTATYEPQHHNGTLMLSWAKRGDGVLEKTVLVLADGQERLLTRLAGDLLCKGPPGGAFVLEGALVLRNLKPYAMVTVNGPARAADRGQCEPSRVELLELGDLSSEWSVSVLRTEAARQQRVAGQSEEPTSSGGWFTEANSPFGYIVYTLFLAYSMLYTMLYFILAVGKSPDSTEL